MSVSRVRVRACVCACGCECVRACTWVSVLGGGRARRAGACVKDRGEEQAWPDVTAVTRGGRLEPGAVGAGVAGCVWKKIPGRRAGGHPGNNEGLSAGGVKGPHVHPQTAHGGEGVKGRAAPWQAAGPARGAAAVALDPNQTGLNYFVGGSDSRGAEKWVSRVVSGFLISGSIFVPLAACLGLHHLLPPNCPLLPRFPSDHILLTPSDLLNT